MTCSSIPYVTASPIASHSPTFDTSSIILSPKISTSIAYPHSPRSPTMDHDPSQRSLQTMQISQKSVYRSLFLEILNSFASAILCFTDGSKIGYRIGLAYSIIDHIFASRHRNSASILTVELQAIFQCLEKILSTPFPQSHTFLIAFDSLSTRQPFQMFILPTP